jgi:hypothetical protein
MSGIGLPKGMSRDDAYIAGVADGADALTAQLYDVADDYECDVLDALRTKAGIVWTCPVNSWTSPKHAPCDDCGRTEAEAIAYVNKMVFD